MPFLCQKLSRRLIHGSLRQDSAPAVLYNLPPSQLRRVADPRTLSSHASIAVSDPSYYFHAIPGRQRFDHGDCRPLARPECQDKWLSSAEDLANSCFVKAQSSSISAARSGASESTAISAVARHRREAPVERLGIVPGAHGGFSALSCLQRSKAARRSMARRANCV